MALPSPVSRNSQMWTPAPQMSEDVPSDTPKAQPRVSERQTLPMRPATMEAPMFSLGSFAAASPNFCTMVS